MTTILCGLWFVVGLVMAQSPNGEQDVRATVEAFYAAFNGHDFGTDRSPTIGSTSIR